MRYIKKQTLSHLLINYVKSAQLPADNLASTANLAYEVNLARRKTNLAEKSVDNSRRIFHGAGDEARTRYLHLGKVALYRMSYTRGTK